MASTRNINNKNEYCLFKRQNEHIMDNRLYKHRRIAYDNAIPCAGINLGQVPNTVLSYNPTDIESRLYGINSTNLVNPQGNFTPRLKSQKSVAFFERPKVFLPEPLAIENNRRPPKPI